MWAGPTVFMVFFQSNGGCNAMAEKKDDTKTAESAITEPVYGDSCNRKEGKVVMCPGCGGNGCE